MSEGEIILAMPVCPDCKREMSRVYEQIEGTWHIRWLCKCDLKKDFQTRITCIKAVEEILDRHILSDVPWCDNDNRCVSNEAAEAARDEIGELWAKEVILRHAWIVRFVAAERVLDHLGYRARGIRIAEGNDLRALEILNVLGIIEKYEMKDPIAGEKLDFQEVCSICGEKHNFPSKGVECEREKDN